MLRRIAVLIAIAGMVVVPLGAAAQEAASRFPSSDPDVRVGTPDDPRFDCAEPDDEDSGVGCESVFDEQWQLFGFAPAQTALTATYKDAGRLLQGQISGVRADAAWKLTTGRPDVVIAVTDTGMRWDRETLRLKIALNAAELPFPQGASSHDADGDGAITPDDWINDTRVTDTNDTGNIDGQDLIRAFSDGTDADNNGYVDDIAGWDWLNDDNDPDDTSSASAASNHGTGRMEEAAQQTNDATGRAGICPECRILPLKVWDSFVVPGDNWAEATVYTADIGAEVQVVANGVLGNTETMRLANAYAHSKGVALMHVSSDLNTANHNYPTNYAESVYINGCVADIEGAGGNGNEITGQLGQLGLPADVPVQTWFRQAGLTQFGAKATVCFMGATGSQATGQAGGGAGLIISRGRDVAAQIGGELTAGEVKQILTLSAEDVLPENTIGVGIPDPAQVGFDEHFGYGRADLGAAVAMVAPGTIPPDVLMTTPRWWHLLDPVDQPLVPVTGNVSANRASSFTWDIGWATGVEPADDGFTSFGTGSSSTALMGGVLGQIPMADVAAALPGSAAGTPPSDPNSYVFTIRIRVTDDLGNVGEDRRALFGFHDPDQPDGWPRFVDTGGESGLKVWDLDGDGDLEIVEADSSGFVSVVNLDGTHASFFNGGTPLRLPAPWFHHPNAPGFVSGAVPAPGTQARTIAIADVDGDLEPELLVTASDGRLFLYDATGALEPGFPVSVDVALSLESVQTKDNHVKRGFLAAPSIGDVDDDGDLEIIAAALDGHVYGWDHAGTLLPGFPFKVADPDETFSGGELIQTPGLGDLDGDGDLELVLMSNEVYAARADAPASINEIQANIAGVVINLAANALGGSARAYAFHHDGTLVSGWPVKLNGLLPDILPYIGPSQAVALGDLDGDDDDEVVTSLTSGEVTTFDGDGSLIATLPSTGAIGNNTDPTKIINLFENAVLGDVDGQGGLDVTKAGLSLNGIVNLLAAGQNFPFEYVIQAWDTQSNLQLPGYPTSHDDFLLLSSPAIADVNGSGGNEIIAGSGLYLLNAYGALGQQAAGFPKLTGGWTYAVPTVADLDGDGDVEILASTREGWRHLWDLDGAATIDGSNQWWTDGHDERNTLRHGTDTRPPTRVQDLAADSTDPATATALTFTTTGDDWVLGNATSYEVLLSTTLVAVGGWGAVTPATTVDALTSGSSQTIDVSSLLGASTAAVAIVGVDDAGNRSQPAVIAFAAPEPEPTVDPDVPLPATGGGAAWLGLAILAGTGLSLRRGHVAD